MIRFLYSCCIFGLLVVTPLFASLCDDEEAYHKDAQRIPIEINGLRFRVAPELVGTQFDAQSVVEYKFSNGVTAKFLLLTQKQLASISDNTFLIVPTGGRVLLDSKSRQKIAGYTERGFSVVGYVAENSSRIVDPLGSWQFAANPIPTVEARLQVELNERIEYLIRRMGRGEQISDPEGEKARYKRENNEKLQFIMSKLSSASLAVLNESSAVQADVFNPTTPETVLRCKLFPGRSYDYTDARMNGREVTVDIKGAATIRIDFEYWTGATYFSDIFSWFISSNIKFYPFLANVQIVQKSNEVTIRTPEFSTERATIDELGLVLRFLEHYQGVMDVVEGRRRYGR